MSYVGVPGRGRFGIEPIALGSFVLGEFGARLWPERNSECSADTGTYC